MDVMSTQPSAMQIEGFKFIYAVKNNVVERPCLATPFCLTGCSLSGVLRAVLLFRNHPCETR
jgi:hypothetical protein